MLLNALSFLSGVCLLQQLAELPQVSFGLISAILLLLATIACWFYCRHLSLVPTISPVVTVAGFFLAGLLWAFVHAQHYLEQRLPEQLAGLDIRIEGVIEEIPLVSDHVQRFRFNVNKIEYSSTDTVEHSFNSSPALLQLSWYYGEKVNAGESWSFMVRLKPPHGFYNPGGFDYEGWLYEQGVHATGYIRKSPVNKKLADASRFSLDRVRQDLSQQIRAVTNDKPFTGLLTALAVGDRSPISKQHWDVLINTGTNHLMAISGLHIGLAAAFGFWLTRRLVPAGLMKRVPVQQLSIAAGLVVASVYALLAGLSIPTQRALLMLICVAGACLMRRNFRPLNILAIALLLILIIDPVAVLSVGFWFSFMAVAVILYVFSGRLTAEKNWKKWGWMQLSIALALFPVSLLLFQQASLVSPLANLFLVPYVSFLVVPLVLLSLLVMPVSSGVAAFLFNLAHDLLAFIWPLLEWLSEQSFSHWVQPAAGLVEVILALTGVMILLAPRGFPAKWLGLVLILPLTSGNVSQPVDGEFEFTLLDVGQGLSAVIKTHQHVLVFDTGNKFSDRLDSGEAVIVPFLRQQSIKSIDRLIVSHGDADHIGGAMSVLEAYPDTELVGQDIEHLNAEIRRSCLAGESWQWDGVDFTFMHPDKAYSKRNNRSCVLKVSNQAGSLLIAGDIEKVIEQKLIAGEAGQLKSNVLVVPHHGSKSSSTKAFISAVDPETALFATGYRNRYRLPNSEIVARYIQSGAKVFITGLSGAVNIRFHPQQGITEPDRYRHSHPHYWNHRIAQEW